MGEGGFVAAFMVNNTKICLSEASEFCVGRLILDHVLVEKMFDTGSQTIVMFF